MREISTVYGIQQGSSSTLAVRNESSWFVYREDWEAAKLLRTDVVAGPFATKAEAKAAQKRIEAKK